MILPRTVAADITTAIGNYSFRATEITAYLQNGGTLERAAAVENHASTRTTQLYDRRSDGVMVDEVTDADLVGHSCSPFLPPTSAVRSAKNL